MKKSFRQTVPFICLCVILIAFAFAGCGANDGFTDWRPALAKIKYSNLSHDRRLSRRLEKALEGLFTDRHLKMH